MKRALLIFVAMLATAAAEPDDLIRWMRWHIEAIYSRSETDVPMDANMKIRVITHSFAVIQLERSEHPAIKQITIDSMGRDPKKWEQQTRIFERLAQGDRVFLTVAASASSFKDAEASKLGVLMVSPNQLEIGGLKPAANHSPEAMPGQRPPTAPSPSSGAPRL